MGCGFKIDDTGLIFKLLKEKNNFQDLSSSKENELCSWSLEFTVRNISILSSRLGNSKTNPKSVAVSGRTFFGYKSNNKVNNYTFRHYKTSENYMIQYRNENKTQRCLPYNMDACETSVVPFRADVSFEGPISNIVTHKAFPETTEKPLIHQVRFWQNQNPLYHSVIENNVLEEGLKINNNLQLGSTALKSNAFTQRSIFNTKRNLDMVVPQGTTYDILSDENQMNQRDDPDKLNLKVGDGGSGVVSIPYTFIREPTKMKKFTKEGGSLEFAKLLDEKLRQLYEQRSLYHPIIEISRVKPESRNTKSVTRLKSACQIKERSMQNNSLNSLSVNGQSAGSRFVNPPQRLPMSSEGQCSCCNPCLLPQMPAFGMHNFPKFIVYHKCTNAKYPDNDRDE